MRVTGKSAALSNSAGFPFRLAIIQHWLLAKLMRDTDGAHSELLIAAPSSFFFGCQYFFWQPRGVKQVDSLDR